MKKEYKTPKTESIQLSGLHAIMVGSSLLDINSGSGEPGLPD